MVGAEGGLEKARPPYKMALASPRGCWRGLWGSAHEGGWSTPATSPAGLSWHRHGASPARARDWVLSNNNDDDIHKTTTTKNKTQMRPSRQGGNGPAESLLAFKIAACPQGP